MLRIHLLARVWRLCRLTGLLFLILFRNGVELQDLLKLFESLPVIFEKLDDMNGLNQLLKIFFSNFIIEPIKKDTFKGSKVSYKLNEPWKGFIESNDFVCGAG